ncbi:F0F1 ATP synthase subunit B [Pseudohoeflea coraliihabitans]|uniref:ATP synthase subunit b n=1 Tax=Pseudohoeflea coraliihabitans TaxID=2860393 RepID=A0ABS6WLY1_9HYPH|nr:F0F1 ATP synthase subunit B [Pseudohoeflea sp. DP4N28-3]MBW3096979.1 F0F1 ATP synthase subunit B [Pseudohoeflea sp. DP4N28-3]
MFVTPAFAQQSSDGALPDPVDTTPAAGEVQTETGVADHGEAHGAFPPFDSSTFASQILWLAITFGLFYLFMNRVIVPRIGGILEHRRDRIAQDLGEANRLKEEADNAIAAYEQELATARNRAAEIAQAARDKAKAAADAERTKVEGELAARMAEAETHISAIKGEALGEVDAIATDVVSELVEHLLGGKVTKAQAAAAVRDAQAK